MLTELNIQNLAIIDRLHVSFAGGLNVLTGETGAGKSIIIDAVNLLLGDRARVELVRTGAEQASVEAMFDLDGEAEICRQLELGGVEHDGELLVKRIVARSGRNRVFINGSLATLQQLRHLTPLLVNIYGQHEHQDLQRPETHLAFLDRFAGLEAELERYEGLFRELRSLRERLEKLESSDRERQQQLDLLSFQAREIDQAALAEGEDEELERERSLLQHGERLLSVCQGGYQRLYGGDDAVCGHLGSLGDELEDLAAIDPELGRIGESVRSALYGLEDAAQELHRYAEAISFDPQRQGQVEERLALIRTLKRKYGASVGDILSYRQQIEGQLGELGNLDATRKELNEQIDRQQQVLMEVGDEISRHRRSAGQRLTKALQAELADLALGKARFEVRFTPLAEPGRKGLERGEFFLAANPGEEPRPLARIASGGELSRLMLALKRVSPEGEGVKTLIFDEVDAGIGGVTATAVGEKLREVARGRQVLCITHLPQVAAFADCHFRVEKNDEAGRTFTRLSLLDEEERIGEMARMLSGAKVTESTLQHAREMIGASLGS